MSENFANIEQIEHAEHLNINMFWNEKVVLLTGASSGIGEALAIAIAKNGATLGLLARREEMLNDLAARGEAIGGRALALACDVTDSDAVHAAAQRLLDKFG